MEGGHRNLHHGANQPDHEAAVDRSGNPVFCHQTLMTSLIEIDEHILIFISVLQIIDKQHGKIYTLWWMCV